MDEFSRRSDLERAREVLWLAIDGNRQLQRATKKGETFAMSEPAAPLIRELRQVVAELESLGAAKTKGNPLDELHARREGRATGTEGR